MEPISEPVFKFKCHACGQDVTLDQEPGQVRNHALMLSARLVTINEQLAGIKKKETPNFLLLIKEKEALESELRIWKPLSEKAHEIMMERGRQRANPILPTGNINHKDPG